jgi:hypothetical protein
MGWCLVAAVWISVTSPGVPIPESDRTHQQQVFQRYWGTDFVWKYDDLPTEGGVEEDRIPYSGYIYPDRSGGTVSAMRKYDQAFHGGRLLATAHEQWDNNAYRQPTEQRVGLLRRQVTRMEIPNWHGHCNGWAAAAIRHAEPQRSVQRNGVVFSPADIKGLLAELYIFNDIEDLSGSSRNIQAGLLHAVVANWIGRGSHALGMEADPGPEKWNYPAYAFESTAVRRSDRSVDVRMTLRYAKDSQGEFHQSPRIERTKSFSYRLDLNHRGEITGGMFYQNSARIDMLWLPLHPKPPGHPRHQRGNPHLNVDRILGIWRDSVPEETRRTWLIVDPSPADCIVDAQSSGSLVPIQISGGMAPATTGEPAG